MQLPNGEREESVAGILDFRALLVVVQKEDVAEVSKLLGGNVEGTPDGQAILEAALQTNNLEIITMLFNASIGFRFERCDNGLKQ